MFDFSLLPTRVVLRAHVPFAIQSQPFLIERLNLKSTDELEVWSDAVTSWLRAPWEEPLPTGEARVILLREKGINCPQFATWASVTGNLRLVKPRDLAGIDQAEYVLPAIPSRPRADTLW